MPPALAARFTTGELAVLRIVADEVQGAGPVRAAHGRHRGAGRGVPHDGAERDPAGARLGMLERQERRRTGARA